ncbi:MAG: NAD-dependent epimerase/dehydratase family protein [Gemmataceae bacterium]
MTTASNGSVLIVGCGYLGHRAARAWREQGRRVLALTRQNAAALAAQGIEPIIGDVLKPETLTKLPHVQTVLYAVARDRTSGQSMRDVYVQGMTNVLNHLPVPERFLLVSSSSVYGQTDGSTVSETSQTEPVEESGQIVLDVEKRLRGRMPQANILRFAGIYGPDRILRRQALLAGEPLVGDAEKWINLIHVWDGVRAVLAAESIVGECINIADGQPVTRRDLYTFLAEKLGAPSAKFEPGESGRGDTNRQIDISKARRLLGFAPHYPDYRVGFEASLAGLER